MEVIIDYNYLFSDLSNECPICNTIINKNNCCLTPHGYAFCLKCVLQNTFQNNHIKPICNIELIGLPKDDNGNIVIVIPKIDIITAKNILKKNNKRTLSKLSKSLILMTTIIIIGTIFVKHLNK